MEKDLPDFTSNNCPKCTSPYWDREYHAREIKSYGYDGPEYIKHTCRECGYSFKSKCYDASPKVEDKDCQEGVFCVSSTL